MGKESFSAFPKTKRSMTNLRRKRTQLYICSQCGKEFKLEREQLLICKVCIYVNEETDDLIERF